MNKDSRKNDQTDKRITILTPAYNRGYILPRLYRSLKHQMNQEFEWMIVNDGSDDNTDSLVSAWMKEAPPFPIHYIRTENGGKHRAVNRAVSQIHTPWTFIVDSDDWLLDDALKSVYEWIQTVESDALFGAVSGLRGYTAYERIGEYPSGISAGGYIDATNLQRRKLHLTGDKAEIYRTSLLRSYPFPEIAGETFIAEGVIWDQIAEDGYKIRWFNKIIYITDYLEDGLTRHIDSLRLRNFKGYTLEVRREMGRRGFYKYRILGRYCFMARKKGLKRADVRALLLLAPVPYYTGVVFSFLYECQELLAKRTCSRRDVSGACGGMQSEGLSVKKWNLYVNMLYQYIASWRGAEHAVFLDREATVREILAQKKTFIRYGDGEFDIMEGKSIHYQACTPALRKALRDILDSYIAGEGKGGYLVGMPHAFLKPSGRFMLTSRRLLSCWSHTRYFFRREFDRKVCYGDAFLFSGDGEAVYRHIWTDAAPDQVVFVHHAPVYAEQFEKTYHIPTVFVRILPENAFEELERIYCDVCGCVSDAAAQNKRLMVLISAGPCGKVLAHRLAQDGIWAIDTGHCWDEPLQI